MQHKIQIDNLVREATTDETEALEARQAQAQAQVEAQAEALEAKTQAKASALAKLGLTADEAAALFG